MFAAVQPREYPNKIFLPVNSGQSLARARNLKGGLRAAYCCYEVHHGRPRFKRDAGDCRQLVGELKIGLTGLGLESNSASVGCVRYTYAAQVASASPGRWVTTDAAARTALRFMSSATSRYLRAVAMAFRRASSCWLTSQICAGNAIPKGEVLAS